MKFEMQFYPGIMLGIMTQTGTAEFPDKTIKGFTETSIYIPFIRVCFYNFKEND